MDTENGNRGHGHVYPRPDGDKARCGGPLSCAECALEKGWKDTQPKAAQDKSRRWHQHLDKCVQCRRGLRLGEQPFDLCPAGDKILTSP